MVGLIGGGADDGGRIGRVLLLLALHIVGVAGGGSAFAIGASAMMAPAAAPS